MIGIPVGTTCAPLHDHGFVSTPLIT